MMVHPKVKYSGAKQVSYSDLRVRTALKITTDKIIIIIIIIIIITIKDQ